MITAVATIAPYLVKLPGRTGWYFQRKVPADLAKSIGKQLWRWKAGTSENMQDDGANAACARPRREKRPPQWMVEAEVEAAEAWKRFKIRR